ncbi:MAG: ATP synthase F1 subunit delta [Deltaproteobacteria bacterium]|nr:ATP synthase F1 subunit delta [Deltaproteobacteria bacterium]
MRNFTISRRYARALLSLGKEDGNYLKYGEELKAFSELLKRETQAQYILQSPIYDFTSRSNLLKAILEKAGLSPTVNSFIRLLLAKGRIRYLEDISLYYAQLTDELSNIKRAMVTAAVQLSDDIIQRIQATLKEVVQKEVVVTVKQDPSIIGGIVAQVGDLTLDGSLRTQLKSLKESLRRGEGV